MPSSFHVHPSSFTGAPYRAPVWLPGGHAQTVYASLCVPRPAVRYRRERWDTPDGDFIDLDWVEGGQTPISRTPDRHETPGQGNRGLSPVLALFHGLEGSSNSHYARALMAAARDEGWRGVVVHFRGCSGEPNRLARAYHSGDTEEIDWVARRLRGIAAAVPLYVAGVSLGANALLKWLGESGAAASTLVDRAAGVSAPLDLMASGDALGQGLNLLYARHFLATLKPKALDKLTRHPDIFPEASVRAASTLRAFDNAVTAPLHGFKDTDDYWTRASSKPWLTRITVPTLVLNAKNDPFMPRAALPGTDEIAPAVTLEQPEDGGHVGFVSGPFPGNLGWLPARLLGFFAAHVTEEVSNNVVERRKN